MIMDMIGETRMWISFPLLCFVCPLVVMPNEMLAGHCACVYVTFDPSSWAPLCWFSPPQLGRLPVGGVFACMCILTFCNQA